MIDLIPAIDIIQGKCVRLTQGQYDSQKVYNEQPLEVAQAFEAHGLKRLHVVDLDGAASQHVVNYRVLEQIASRTNLVIDFGGGIKSEEDLRIAFDAGASMITVGSVAVKQPEIVARWLKDYGADKVIVGADVNERKIAINGWKEDSSVDLFEFITDYIRQGVNQVLCTDISKDGMLEGPSVKLYKEVMEQFPELYLIASGGVSRMDDLYELQELGVPAIVFGKAIYEGRISLKDIEKFIIS